MNSINNKKVLRFEQIVAGAILVFEQLDFLDMELLMQKIESAGYQIQIEYSNEFSEIENYVLCGVDRHIRFKTSVSKAQTAVRRNLMQVAGKEVLSYIGGLDIDAFREEKNRVLAKEKMRILDCGKVLLITDNPNDVDCFKAFGFSDVNCFPSILNAQLYFEGNPQELEDYNLIVFGGDQRLHQRRDFMLNRRIKTLQETKRPLVVDFRAYYQNNPSYFVTVENYRGFENPFMSTKTLSEALNGIVTGAIANGTTTYLKEKVINKRQLSDITAVPFRVFPDKKSDLTILFCHDFAFVEKARLIAKNMGLQVIFKDSASFAFENLSQDFGHFDILIGDQNYQNQLSTLAIECSTQCRFMNLPLALMATFEDKGHLNGPKNSMDNRIVYGNRIDVDFVYGGSYITSSDLEETVVEHRVFSAPFKTSSVVTQETREEHETLARFKALLEVLVRQYNAKVMSFGEQSLDVGRFKDFSEYNSSLKEIFANERDRIAKVSIKTLDEIVSMAKDYLKLKSEGCLDRKLQGVNIYETSEGCRIEIVQAGITLSAITIPDNYADVDNLRLFSIQIWTKKRNLSCPRNVGLYGQEFEELSVPQRPDEREVATIEGFHKKLSVSVKPLLDSAKAKNGQTGKKFKMQKKGGTRA